MHKETGLSFPRHRASRIVHAFASAAHPHHLPPATNNFATITAAPAMPPSLPLQGCQKSEFIFWPPKGKIALLGITYLPSRNMRQVLEDTWGRFPLTLSRALRLNQSISMLSSHELPVHLRNASLAKKPFVPLIFFPENYHYNEYLPSTFFLSWELY